MSGPNSGSSDLCVWVFQFVCLYLCVCICAPVNWAGESTCHWLLRFKARQTEVWYKSEIKTQFEIKVAPMHKSFVTRPKCWNTPFNVSWSSSQASRSTFIVCRLLSPFDIRRSGFEDEEIIIRVAISTLITFRNFQWARWEPDGESRAPWGPRYPWYFESGIPLFSWHTMPCSGIRWRMLPCEQTGL